MNTVLPRSRKPKKTELIVLEKRSTERKCKKPSGFNQSVGKIEIDMVKSKKVTLKQKKKHAQNIAKQTMIGIRKTAAKEDSTTFDLKERDIRKSMRCERKNSKGIETESAEVKTNTRTRRLRVEDKLIESKVSKNMSTRLRSQIKSSGSSSFIASLTTVDNPPISGYENKKKTKDLNNGNRRKITRNTLHDNDHSSINVKKENLNHAIGVPRTSTRTRSATFQQGTSLETKSKQNQGDGISVGTKQSVSTAISPDDHKYSDKQLYPQVILKRFDINNLPGIKLTNNQHQVKKSVETLEKPSLKKQKTGVENKKHQQSNISNKSTPQNKKNMNTSIKKEEPLAKRTRRSLNTSC